METPAAFVDTLTAVTSPPPEHVERRTSTPQYEPDPWVQMNVRIRKSMYDRLDARRKNLELTRDDWVRHVIEWALLQPPATPVHTRRRNGR